MLAKRRPFVTLLLAASPLIAIAGCGGGDDTTTQPSSTPEAPATSAPGTTAAAERTTTTNPHVEDLAEGETATPAPTATLTANLVPVAGYSYADVPRAEVEQALEVINPDVVAGMSLHGVVRDSDEVEIGFLQLYEFADIPPAGVEADVLVGLAGTDAVARGEQEVAGTTVLAFENPEAPASRYTYAWMRHGVAAAVDGPEAAPIEAWLELYLAEPVTVNQETGALADRMVPVPGYLYGNFDDTDTREYWVEDVFGDVPSSLHQINDADGPVGFLILVQPDEDLTAADAAGLLVAAHPDDLSDEVTTETADGTPVVVVDDPADDAEVLVFTEDGVVGLLLAVDRELALSFLDAFLAT